MLNKNAWDLKLKYDVCFYLKKNKKLTNKLILNFVCPKQILQSFPLYVWMPFKLHVPLVHLKLQIGYAAAYRYAKIWRIKSKNITGRDIWKVVNDLMKQIGISRSRNWYSNVQFYERVINYAYHRHDDMMKNGYVQFTNVKIKWDQERKLSIMSFLKSTHFKYDLNQIKSHDVTLPRESPANSWHL